MDTKRIGVIDAERFDSKTALYMPVTRTDQYRSHGAWYSVNEEWRHGRQVEECNIAGRHQYAVGEIVTVIDLMTTPIGQCQITAIEMLDTAAMTQADYSALGYKDQADYEANAASGTRGWLIRIARLTPSSHTVNTIQ